MALDIDHKKMSVMDWGNVFDPGLPFSPGSIGQDDQQALLWGQSDELWGAQEVTLRPIDIIMIGEERRTLLIPEERRTIMISN